MRLVEMQVQDYIKVLASNAPAPGGGSASALSGAQGIALAGMVAALTIGKKKYADELGLCLQVSADADKLRQRMLQQIDADTEAFNLVSAAYQLPKETDAQKAERSAAIAAATLEATQVPFATMELALEALKLTQALVGHSNNNCASDLGVAALNLEACLKGAWLNVCINLDGIKDPEKAQRFSCKAKSMLEKAAQIVADILAGIGMDAIG